MENEVVKRVEKTPIKRYEIWIGQYSLGQGYGDQLKKPMKVATVGATSFRGACLIHEHHMHIQGLSQRMSNGEVIDINPNVAIWAYDFITNTNSWTGEYYETEEEALKTFI